MTNTPAQKIIDEIRLEISGLLAKRTKLNRWQAFFATYPNAFSSVMSFSASGTTIKLVDEHEANPDKVLYEHRGEGPARFGMLEVEWQCRNLEESQSQQTVRLLPDIEAALDQYRSAVVQGEATLRHANRSVLCVGNRSNLFVITGMGQETCDAFDQEIEQSRPLPNGVERLSYDFIARLLTAQVSPQTIVLSPCVAMGEDDTPDVLRKLRMDFDRKDWESRKCG